jgi:LysM repeat protein
MSKPPIFKPVGHLSRKQPGGPTFRWAVFAFLVLHVLFFSGLLLQGCRPKTEVASAPPPTNDLPTMNDMWEPVEPTPPPATNAPGALLPENPGNATPPAGNPAPAAETAAPAAESTPPATNNIPDLTGGAAVTPPPIDTNVAGPSPSGQPSPAGTTVEESRNLARAQEYVVRSGDTLWGIARQHGIALKALQDANPDVTPKTLQPGATLIIPPPAPRPAPVEEPYDGTLYTIQKGDTLSKIARKFGVTVKAIQEENNLKSTRIYTGKKLKIPSAPAAR